MSVRLTKKNQKWLEDFIVKNKRPPKILYIGNIANNAYNNAKLMNEAGLICDVICYDNYHIMSCPEWEDAEFLHDYGSDFNPNWIKADVKNFVRPNWFAQGSVNSCIDYLIQLRSGNSYEAKLCWSKLKLENNTVENSHSLSLSENIYKIVLFSKRRIKRLYYILKIKPVNFFNQIYLKSVNFFNQIYLKSVNFFNQIYLKSVNFFNQIYLKLEHPHIVSLYPNSIISDAYVLFYTLIKLLFRIVNILSWPIIKLFSILIKLLFRIVNILSWLIIKLFSILIKLLFRIVNILSWPIIKLFFMLGVVVNKIFPQPIKDDTFSFDKQTANLVRVYKNEFPLREDELTQDCFASYKSIIYRWRKLFKHYDLVQGYSTDPILPLLSGKLPYLAFEHGTLRDIPYEKSFQGRVTSLSYRKANHVFVTNTDCIDSAKKLCDGKFTVINHPYDECHPEYNVSDYQSCRKSLKKELDSDYLFFFPTRHDWIPGKGFNDKSNDVFLNAAIQLRLKGIKIGIICCDWGNNVQESKGLINSGGISKNVKWVKPMAIIAFEKTCMASDFVVDQFKLGAFGGVFFKALATGKPIISYLDMKSIEEQFSEPPPLINCKDTNEIVAQVVSYTEDSNKMKDWSVLSKQWLSKYHSKDETINKQIDKYAALIKEYPHEK
jgi:hypothetical protein